MIAISFSKMWSRIIHWAKLNTKIKFNFMLLATANPLFFYYAMIFATITVIANAQPGGCVTLMEDAPTAILNTLAGQIAVQRERNEGGLHNLQTQSNLTSSLSLHNTDGEEKWPPDSLSLPSPSANLLSIHNSLSSSNSSVSPVSMCSRGNYNIFRSYNAECMLSGTEDQSIHRLAGTLMNENIDSWLGWDVSSIIFASCAKQDENDETIWRSIASLKPDGFIWIGDAIYPEDKEVATLDAAYKLVLSRNYYKSLIGKLKFLEGTWDDHDFGVNGGDKRYRHKASSQQLFLNFLGILPNNSRRNREGVYSSHMFHIKNSTTATSDYQKTGKLILLDTRYHRETPWYLGPQILSELRVFSILLGGFRWLFSILGFFSLSLSTLFLLGNCNFNCLSGNHEGFKGRISFAKILALHFTDRVLENYNGDLLGEAQWSWLEKQLRNSTASAHLIVSSMQVFSALGVTETWGHYPVARKRLFSLIQRYKPQGVLFISGDVHFAEFLGSKEHVLEVTSSGLTHSVGDNFLTSTILGKLLLPLYGSYRLAPDQVYLGHNFCLLEIESTEDNGMKMTSSIFSATGNVKMRITQNFHPQDNFEEKYAFLDNIPDVSLKKPYLLIIIILLPLLLLGIWIPQCLLAAVFCVREKLVSLFVRRK